MCSCMDENAWETLNERRTKEREREMDRVRNRDERSKLQTWSNWIGKSVAWSIICNRSRWFLLLLPPLLLMLMMLLLALVLFDAVFSSSGLYCFCARFNVWNCIRLACRHKEWITIWFQAAPSIPSTINVYYALIYMLTKQQHERDRKSEIGRVTKEEQEQEQEIEIESHWKQRQLLYSAIDLNSTLNRVRWI